MVIIPRLAAGDMGITAVLITLAVVAVMAVAVAVLIG